jgi:hypothetical protein
MDKSGLKFKRYFLHLKLLLNNFKCTVGNPEEFSIVKLIVLLFDDFSSFLIKISF